MVTIRDIHPRHSGDPDCGFCIPFVAMKKAVRVKAPEIILDPVEAAKAAGLRYTSDRQPGYRRMAHGKAFRYTTPDGKMLRDKNVLARIRSLVIPPAWIDVWITTYDNGHLQCTGRDARGRKQSRYHPRWREVRDETKYERMALFAEALPVIRKRVANDLEEPGLPREKVLATVVSVMEETHIRVGNEEYARTNKSYGLTTMRTKHVDVRGAKITFDFQGKSRVHHTINLQDRRLAKIIRKISELPGYELFQYVDEEGNRHNIDSSDVNDYLREITGEHFTAKDFRTWAGSVLCCSLLSELEPATTITQAKKNVVQAIAQVASQLGNTPSVCRKCYVHPAVLERYLGAISAEEAKERLEQDISAERRSIAKHAAALHDEERELVNLLHQQALLKKAA
ncbi:DNA topoisomerase IB [Terriglobus sp. ADX1]|uniref:DNA topoisomerase IB n=1 Tax=Terriglobus sp. ADX1 TaxID=2794063 RepID=UPI002FE5260E